MVVSQCQHCLDLEEADWFWILRCGYEAGGGVPFAELLNRSVELV